MTNRVLFQGGDVAAMKASMAGYDVLTATMDQLAFDATGASIYTFARGFVNITASSPLVSGVRQETITFPVAAAKRPIVTFLMAQYNAGTGALNTTPASYSGGVGPSLIGNQCRRDSGGGFTASLWAQVSETAIVFRNNYAFPLRVFYSAYMPYG